ncbi:MATE family multidrug resistance protein [Hasllibacter halocynthiae]|uniref:MATE family multidrug resistance protein n=1 Tax=Hasllibacter halocynthiae TaxID=595589 RepID=A0A2T0X6H3_9RHOB|nr:MATE family efflux transporter [Hasllibacter halocynthiae]PRY94527.1 MATE family multidrug resistance protein [Hasllibacter halocynthiae]
MAETTPVTHRRVLAVAGPIVLSNATVPLLGIVDTAVVGRLGGAAPIGAVGTGAILVTAALWIFGFLRMGTVGLAGQALGEGDRDELSAILSRALLIGGAGGAALVVLQWPIFEVAQALQPATEEVERLARTYMSIRIWSAPAAIAIYGLTGWLIAQERTRAVFAIQVGQNGVNIALSWLLGLGFGFGVAGVAAATLVADVLAAALALWLCRDAFVRPAWRDRARVLDPARLRRLGTVSSDILIRSLLLQAILLSFLFYWSSSLGEVALAANQVLLQFLFLTAYGMDGFAFAAEALVAQAMGARDRARLRRAAVLTSIWGAVTGAAAALAFAFLGGWIVDLLTTVPEVRAEARRYLPWMVATPLVGCAAWMLDGIFIGASQTRDMRNMMAVSAAIYFLAALPLVALFGNHGLWAALLVAFAARGATLALRYPHLEARALR